MFALDPYAVEIIRAKTLNIVSGGDAADGAGNFPGGQFSFDAIRSDLHMVAALLLIRRW